MLGSYTIILVVFSYFFQTEISIIFFLVDFMLFFVLNIGFVITKIKKAKKGIVRNIQLGMGLLLILCAVFIICSDVNEIASGIMGLYGVMMLLTTPFEEIKAFLERKSNTSGQE